MRHVIIVGAGIAGLVAALRLLERGFSVTLYEREPFIGGQLHAEEHLGKEGIFEHSFHFFMNWYHNFWRLVEELGISGHFIPRSTLRYLRSGEYPSTSSLVDFGAPYSQVQNLTSGVETVSDTYLATYSYLDLMTQTIDRSDPFDQFSVNGYLRGRRYVTPRSSRFHRLTLARAFANPSYDSSVASYKSYLKFSYRNPSPMFWILCGNKNSMFLYYLWNKIKSYPNFNYYLKHGLFAINIGDYNCIDKLYFRKMNLSFILNIGYNTKESNVSLLDDLDDAPYLYNGVTEINVADSDVILALPAQDMGHLINTDILRHDPRLGGVRQLRSVPTVAVDLTFKRRIPHIPADHTILIDSKYFMTFVDKSRIWPDVAKTSLSIVASEVNPLLNLNDAGRYSAPNIERPSTVLDFLLKEFHRFVPFRMDDIDFKRTSIHHRAGDGLFINEVGSWNFRCDTETQIANLFLAGAWVRSFIDVVTVEGAIVTGLNAAEAVRRKRRVPSPIEIIKPDWYPDSSLRALKHAAGPLAVGAWMWAWGERQIRDVFLGEVPGGDLKT